MDVQLILDCDDQTCTDVGMACGDLAQGNDLTTAVMLSLFTDGRADEDDVLPDGNDPRGFWADALDGTRMGSKLWLLERARNLPETFRLAEEYATAALQWLVADGVASKVTATAAAARGVDCNNVLALQIDIYKPDKKVLAFKFRYAWDLQQLQTCERPPEFCF